MTIRKGTEASFSVAPRRDVEGSEIYAAIGPFPAASNTGTSARPADTPLSQIGEAFATRDTWEAYRTRSIEAVTLPLVSVIIVNFNYGRYLRTAVESVLGQTYPNIECIVVDNASTDDSESVISALESRHSSLRIIRRAENGWQTRASLDGFAASKGAYVIFLDADDFLLPHAVDSHVFAHLSLRAHVGFTSGDMLQMVGGRVVLASGRNFGEFVANASARPPTRVRSYAHVSGDWPSSTLADELAGKIHLVSPLHLEWIWSPTSGNCFRRDALLLFADDPSLPSLKVNTDLYLARGVNAVCGSAMIDLPIFAYRLHGGNAFSRGAQLDGVLSFDPLSESNNNRLAQLMLLDHVISRADRFISERPLRYVFIERLRLLDVPDHDEALPKYARRSRAARRLVEHFDTLASLMGRAFSLAVLVRFGVPINVVFRTMITRSSRRAPVRSGR